MLGVHYRYPGAGERWALGGVDLAIHDGEYVYVCGASGSGKSTLGMLLNGLIPHFLEGEFLGRVQVDGLDTRRTRVAELFGRVGLVLQNADAQLFNATVEDELAFGLESLGRSPGEIHARVAQVARACRIQGLLGRSPMELSGGEKRLVALGAVLVTDPSLLVLDEPYAHLDWDGARMVRRALRNLHGEGRTVIVIEHRHDGLMQDASRCLILQDGRVSWDGPPCAAQGALRRAGLTPAYPRRESPGRRPPEGPPALEISDLSQRISNRDVLREISLTLARGEVVAVIGRNGAGKTTLVRHLNGLLRPRRGAVRVLGRPVDGRDPSEMAAEVGLAFQNPGDQFFKFRVEEELRVSSRALGREDSEWLAELQAILDLGPLLSRSPFRLSEGEKKRVAIASVLAARPSVLVLDEPTVGQDGRFRERLARVVGALRGRGVTTLLVTHDLDFAGAVADRWIVLEGGRVAGQGAPDDPTMAALLQTLGAHWDHGGRRVATLCGGD